MPTEFSAVQVRAGLYFVVTRRCRGSRGVATGAPVEYSALWGRGGEKWTPQSRLPDFSFAGYHCGEKPLPTVSPGVSVKKFGAKGDGVADDGLGIGATEHHGGPSEDFRRRLPGLLVSERRYRSQSSRSARHRRPRRLGRSSL